MRALEEGIAGEMGAESEKDRDGREREGEEATSATRPPVGCGNHAIAVGSAEIYWGERGFFAGCSQAKTTRKMKIAQGKGRKQEKKGSRPLTSPIGTGEGRDIALTEENRGKGEDTTGRKWGKSCCISISNNRRERL